MRGLAKKSLLVVSVSFLTLGAGCKTQTTNINATTDLSNVPVVNVAVSVPSAVVEQQVTSTVYLVAIEGTLAWSKVASSGHVKKIGCNDYIVPTPIGSIQNPESPLRNALVTLLGVTEKDAAALGLSSTLAKSNLQIGSINQNADGVFVVDLEGTLNPAGLCDDPRMKAQIEETVGEFGKFQILLNGKESNWRCFGDESGLCQ